MFVVDAVRPEFDLSDQGSGMTMQVETSDSSKLKISARMKAAVARTIAAAKEKGAGRFRQGAAPAEDAWSEDDVIEALAFALGPVASATFRTCCIGQSVEVSAPDDRMAAILTEALRRTAVKRPTDRLIDITAQAAGPNH